MFHSQKLWTSTSHQADVAGLVETYICMIAPDVHVHRGGHRAVEWLSPGAEGVGPRTVFVEHVFSAIDPDELERLFEKGQRLPWMVVPTGRPMHRPANRLCH